MPFPHPVNVTKPHGVPERPSEKKRKLRAVVLAALPGTQAQIVRRTGLGVATVSRWLADLYDSDEARIKRWTRTGAKFAGVWGRGAGEHAPCDLVAFDSTQRKDHDRQRKKSEAEQEAQDRARRLSEIKVRRDPMVAALFGAAA